MNNVQIAENALANAKKEEKLKYALIELEQIKKDYEGKCFGSDTFERSTGAGYRSATYYEKFFLKEDDVYVLEYTITLSHFDSYYKKSMKQISYSRNINERQLTGSNEYNAQYNLYSGYSGFRKEISKQKFNELWEISEDANLIIKNAFNGKFPELKQEMITQGDSNNEVTIEKCISDMGIEMIDFKKFPIVHNCIDYRTLPMFDRRRWLPKQYAKPILEWQIKQLEKDCADSFTSFRRFNALQEEIVILKDFIEKEL